MEKREILRRISKAYDVGAVLSIHRANGGSGGVFVLTAHTGRYLVKLNQRADFALACERAGQALERHGLVHGNIIKTRDGELLTAQGIALYRYLDGKAYGMLDGPRMNRAIEYLRVYNSALRQAVFQEGELGRVNLWDWVKALDFLREEAPDKARRAFPGDEERPAMIARAAEILCGREGTLRQGRQLIHADLGADNILFNGEEVAAFIDFTPDYAHEALSLGHFIYWNVLWHEQGITHAQIEALFALYDPGFDARLYRTNLLFACLYRTAGALLQGIADHADLSRLDKRFDILRAILKVMPK